MSEKEACYLYTVDSKAEIENRLNEIIAMLETDTKYFCMVHELMKATGEVVAVCFSRAWALYRLTKRMHQGVVTFAYKRQTDRFVRPKGPSKTYRILSKVPVQRTTKRFAILM